MANYPSTQKLISKEEQEVLEILNLRLNNKHLKEMIENKFSKLIALKDIQNLKPKLESAHTRNGRCTTGSRPSPGSLETRQISTRWSIVVDEDHTLELLHFQTGHMRKLFKSFHEILLIDGTYND